MEENTLEVKLTIDEVNKIMGALGQQPYIQVCQLINKIQQQVGKQLTPDIEKIVNKPEQVIK